MSKVSALSILLLTCFTISVLTMDVLDLSHSLDIATMYVNMDVFRVPLEARAYQPIMIIVRGCSKEIILLAEITIRILANTSIPGIHLPLSKTFTISEPMVVIPIFKEPTCIAVIPGLPVYEKIIDVVEPFGRSVKVKVSVVSEVRIEVLADGYTIYSDSFVVKPTKLTEDVEPLVFTIPSEVIESSKEEIQALLEETGGLSCRGFSWPSETPYRVFVVAIDRESKPTVHLRYSVDGKTWIELNVSKYNPVMSSIDTFVNSVNKFLSEVEQKLNTVFNGFTIPRVEENYFVGYTEIPSQAPGTYVMYYAIAEDGHGHRVESLISMYYVYSKDSNMSILIIDPHVSLWLYQKNCDRLRNLAKVQTQYLLPKDLVTEVKVYRFLAEKLSKVRIIKFHHWEYLAEKYRIYITRPISRAVYALQKLRPKVIVLSNLWLGLNGTDYFDWDLKDIRTPSSTVLAELIRYVKRSHAGVIATHGTLSDSLLAICSNGALSTYKIGALGHVGKSIVDIDPINERTVSSLLGLYLLPLWEELKLSIAEQLCRASITVPQAAAIATAVGSASLHVPYIPFSGRMEVTGEGMLLGWDIPRVFTIEIPGAYWDFGKKAYTEVGWQLVLPRSIAYTAWRNANSSLEIALKVRSRLAELVSYLMKDSASGVDVEELLRRGDEASLRWVLHSLYRGVVGANISDSIIGISIWIPELRIWVNRSVDMDRELVEKLMRILPVKIVALSDDGLAAIIAYDKYWDPEGYRSVYFSFEIEAAQGDIVRKLLIQAVEWVRRWEYRPITELIRGIVRVSKDVAERFRRLEAEIPGTEVLSKAILIPEEGYTKLRIAIPKKGRLYIIAVHYGTPKIDLSVVRNGVLERVDKGRDIDIATILVEKPGIVELSISVDPTYVLTPLYIEIKYRELTIVAPLTTYTTLATSISLLLPHWH